MLLPSRLGKNGESSLGILVQHIIERSCTWVGNRASLTQVMEKKILLICRIHSPDLL